MVTFSADAATYGFFCQTFFLKNSSCKHRIVTECVVVDKMWTPKSLTLFSRCFDAVCGEVAGFLSIAIAQIGTQLIGHNSITTRPQRRIQHHVQVVQVKGSSPSQQR